MRVSRIGASSCFTFLISSNSPFRSLSSRRGDAAQREDALSITIEVLSASFTAKVEWPSIHVPAGRRFLDLEDDPAHGAVGSLALVSAGLPDDIGPTAGNAQSTTSFASPEGLVGWLPRLQL